MAGFTYLLCFLTALACAILLARGYRTNGTRLLFWSALGFWGLPLTNALAVVDLLVLADRDL
jgi:hypothetical protein